MSENKLPPGAQTLPLPDALQRMGAFAENYMTQCVRAQFGQSADQITIVFGKEEVPYFVTKVPRGVRFRVFAKAAWLVATGRA